MSIKICDFKSHGYKKKGAMNGTWLFKKQKKLVNRYTLPTMSKKSGCDLGTLGQLVFIL